MKQYKGIIFDLDGTLLDTLGDLRESMNAILEKYAFPSISPEEAAAFLGNGSEAFLRQSLKRELPETEFAAYLAEYKTYYHNHMECKTKPYEGIKELLLFLQKQGYKTAVVSNKFDQAVKGLCEKYFAGLFDLSLGEGNGLRPKPAPDMPKKAAEVLGIPLAECVYIGDTEVDIATAKAVHMDCISVTWGFRTKEHLLRSGAEVTADSVSALASIL